MNRGRVKLFAAYFDALAFQKGDEFVLCALGEAVFAERVDQARVRSKHDVVFCMHGASDLGKLDVDSRAV